MVELKKIIEKVLISFNLIRTGRFEDEVTERGVKMTPQNNHPFKINKNDNMKLKLTEQ